MIPAARLRALWIRKDRDQYLLAGVVASSIICGYVAGSWHADDRMNMLKNITISAPAQPPKETQEKDLGRLQDAEFIPAKKKVLKKYYRMEDENEGAVPDLEEEDGE